MDTIALEEMKFLAYHGCYDEEKRVGNYFLVNLWLSGNFSEAAETDNIDMALDYAKVYDIVKKQMRISSDLLENVAKRILDAIFEGFSEPEEATVKVSKLNPPVKGEINKVSVTLTR